jgi:hypothetical protein
MNSSGWIQTLIVSFSAALLTGCSDPLVPSEKSDDKATIKTIATALKKSEATRSKPEKIKLLRLAFSQAEHLGAKWPDSEKGRLFLEQSGNQVHAIPQRVYPLAVDTKDDPSFAWALEHGASIDLNYTALQQLWAMGHEWRETVLKYQFDDALPVFMDLAVNSYDRKFFDAHAAAMKEMWLSVRPPMEEVDFTVRYCRFLAEMMHGAVKDKDAERIEFLLDNTPRRDQLVALDLMLKRTLPAVGDFIFHDLKDQRLAMKLIALGYELNGIDLVEAGFDEDFTDMLKSSPAAASDILRLSEWHGGLSDTEMKLLLSMPDNALNTVHHLYIDEAVNAAIRSGDAELSMRMVKYRESLGKPTRHEYNKLMNEAVATGNEALFDYILHQCDDLTIYNIGLGYLGRNEKLFNKYAPQIFRKIYPTMSKEPQPYGTSFGRIYDALSDGNEFAGLYIVQKLNLEKAWERASQGRTLLMDVCHAGNLLAARYLIERKGASVHAETGYVEFTTSLFGSTRGREGKLTPMFFAAQSGNAELIRYLRSRGADVNARSAFGSTPLMHAVSENKLEAAETLIELGASVHTRMYSGVSMGNTSGNLEEVSAALRRAKRRGNQDMIALLEKAGARD